MKINEFELIARVNFKDLKYSQKGVAIGRLLLSKRKANNDNVEYQSFPVTLFNAEAEKLGNIDKGDMVHVTGSLSTSKYEKDGKQIEKIELIANSVEIVDWNEEKKEYQVIDKDEIPF